MGDVWEMGRGDMFIIHKGVLLFLNFGSFTYLSSYFSQSCDSYERLMSLRLKRPHPPYGSYDWPLSCEGEGRKSTSPPIRVV